MALWSTPLTFGSSQQPHRCSGCDNAAMKGETSVLPVRQLLPQPALLTDELFSKKPSHISAKYSGWHCLLAFFQLSRTTLNTPPPSQLPQSALEAQTSQTIITYCLSQHCLLPPLIWLNLLWFPIISYSSTALWNSWFAISKLFCVSHSSLNICFPFFL